MTWNMTHSEESEGLFSKDQEETPDSPEVLLPVGSADGVEPSPAPPGPRCCPRRGTVSDAGGSSGTAIQDLAPLPAQHREMHLAFPAPAPPSDSALATHSRGQTLTLPLTRGVAGHLASSSAGREPVPHREGP